MSKNNDLIQTEQRDNVLLITLNRPSAKNAFDKATAEAMEAAMDLLDRDDELFAGIITGANGTFCSGADLKAAARGERIGTKNRGGFGIFAKPSRKPLIAAVEGFAIAGGFELCLSCDIIIAAEDAKFGLPEVRHGLVAIGGGLFRLPKRLPYHLAMELSLTAELRGSEFFHQYGIVNHVVEPGKALEHAITFCQKMLVNGPTALVATKEIIASSCEWTEEEAWKNQMGIALKAFKSEDRNEGLKAFAEKRKPVWKGR
ncbi:MAG: crotonase/enoyl-CoA hydratase family protein [Spongiibacteraceae bacterium]|nr:crotonase/enoyl-CoA hydratase family protein [Spongiibacteraceae bacterium]